MSALQTSALAYYEVSGQVAWNRDQYLADVMEQARKVGNVPPPDLYARYGLPGDILEEAAFERQVASVLALWRELERRPRYSRLVKMLLTEHAELERAGRLTPNSFAARHADARRVQLERLTRLAEAEAGAATHAGPATVARLRGALGSAVSDADVTEALGKAGVRIVREFPWLPQAPHPRQADLAKYVAQLGVRLSTVVVFGDAVGRGFRILGGFRLADGRVLGETAIAEAGSRVAVLPYSDLAKAASDNVLAILRAAARKPGDLDALLLSEMVERLRPLARSGFIQRAIAAQAQELGLVQEEAGLIAAALLAQDTLDGVRLQVEEELAAGRLRSALRLAAGLPAEDLLRERAAAVDAEVSEITRRADAEQGRGRSEQAAALLADAIDIAGDDAGLPERLAAIPPPPPREATARVNGDHVLITWKPSLATAGRVQYRVMRGESPAPASPFEGVTVVTRTERTDVTDADAPAGTGLFYRVFAARGGDVWSPPAIAPAMFIPEVADVPGTGLVFGSGNADPYVPEAGIGGGSAGDGGGGGDDGRVPPARSRYLMGQCPESVTVGTPFSLVAAIVLDTGPKSVELEPFDVPPEGQEVLLVLYAPGLRVLREQQQTVHVPPGRDSKPVRFELRADAPGPVTVSITAWIGGTHLGELRVEIAAERDRAPGPHREVLAEITTQPTAGAVSLVVRYDPLQHAYRFEFRDEDNPNEVHSNLAYDPAPLVEQLVADLDSLARGRSGYSAQQTRDYLVNAGARLWRQLIPGQLREQFWDRQDRIRQLTILADKDAVPWELLYPMDVGHDAGFLVEQFPVTRAIFGWRPTRALRLRPTRFVLPEGSLPEAVAEIEAMRRLLDPGQAPSDVISALTPLTDLIGNGNFGLLHFACHNTCDPVGGSSIRLGNVRFTATLLEVAVIQKALRASAPTVFINACRSAGLAATYNRLDGWASQFLEAGAAAFIGSLWAVSDGAAREFAEELYRRLLQGLTLGEAVMQARQAAASQPDDPTWLAYAVYGDPRAAISRSP